MLVGELLAEDRVEVLTPGREALSGKVAALERIAGLLARTCTLEPVQVQEQLSNRETLQSTGIGDGVAIPHASLDALSTHVGALLLVPEGVDFDSIDHKPARIILGILGPRQPTGAHLRLLARVSRLLQSPATRQDLLEASSPAAVLSLIGSLEQGGGGAAR